LLLGARKAKLERTQDEDSYKPHLVVREESKDQYTTYVVKNTGKGCAYNIYVKGPMVATNTVGAIISVVCYDLQPGDTLTLP